MVRAGGVPHEGLEGPANHYCAIGWSLPVSAPGPRFGSTMTGWVPSEPVAKISCCDAADDRPGTGAPAVSGVTW